MSGVGVAVLVIILFLLVVLSAAIKVVKEYERGVVFRLGRLVGTRGPGLILLIPFIERMVKVDLRTVTMDVPAQEVITRDNVTVRVNAVAYFRVLDPNAAVVNVADYIRATSQIAQTTLRSVLGQSVLDELLSERDKINQELQRIIDEQTEPWGVKVSIVEVKDVELPQSMQRAMARQASVRGGRREGEAGRAAVEAERLLRGVFELFPDNPLPAFRLAELYVRTGRPAEAVELLDDIVERLDPTLADVYALRGRAREALREPEAARQDYLRALSLDPSLGEVREALRRLGVPEESLPPVPMSPRSVRPAGGGGWETLWYRR